MEDNRLKQLFKDFDPPLSSSLHFMTKLQKNMEAVEFVRQYEAAQKKRNKMAVAIAAAAGFAAGVIMTLLYPFIIEWIHSLNISLPLSLASKATMLPNILVWLIIAGISVLTAYQTYESAASQLSPKLETTPKN